ncbi:MAG: hypothetical protein AB1469_03180 [Pseudomonadota bacterium]
MKSASDMGMNRTGAGTAPRLSKEMIDAARAGTPSSGGDGWALASEREEYIEQGERIGSMPPPSSLKGAATTLLKMGMGEKPNVLLDKMGERLAFERTGSRLYEALMSKVQALGGGADGPTLDEINDIYNDEVRHFELLRRALEDLGADPTVQTPSADVSGVTAMGILQVLTDPRTSVAQCLHAVLVAELADNDGWRMLIDLARSLDQDDMAKQFQQALTEEERHLRQVRGWVSRQMLAEAT